MKNTYVECKNWSWEDKLLYIKACVGDEIPHNKLCGWGVDPKEKILDLYKNEAAFLMCCSSGMISYDDANAPGVYPGRKLVNLASLKLRTKVEYVKLTSVFELNADEMHNGVYGWLNDDKEFFPATNEALLVGCLTNDNLYRKVERPIEWWEDAAEFIKSNSFNIGKQAFKVGDGAFYVDSKMTRDQWCDFARILLEQEGE